MRSVLRNLPIRWQITALHTTILALVLAAGGVLLWQTQREFLLNSLVARQTGEVRALISAGVSPKLEALIFPTPLLDRTKLKQLYPQIIADIFPAGEDPMVGYKKLALLNPKLAGKLTPSDKDGSTPKQLAEMIAQLGPDDLFPPDQTPADTSKKLAELSPTFASMLFGTVPVDQGELKKWSAALAQQLGAKDRGAVIFALDGTVLAHSDSGPACRPDTLPANGALSTKDGDAFFAKLKAIEYFEELAAGQLTLVLPVLWQQDRPLVLAQVCVPTDSIDGSLSQLAASLVIGWVLVVGLATALGVTAMRRVLRPLDQVVATTRRIAAGDLRQRVGLPAGRTEIAQLGAAFDAMVARLEAAFATQRRFVADAAHELRTPLTALSASVELLGMGAADDDPATARRLLRHLDNELSRVIRLTNDLLTLSRLDARPQIELRPTDLSSVLQELGDQSRGLLRGQELQVDIAPQLWVQGDPDRLRQVVLNLLDNARKYTPPDGQIALRASSECSVLSSKFVAPESTPTHNTQVTMQKWTSATQNSTLKTQNWVVVEVVDSGVGMPVEALPHLFERFYRVDSARTRANGGSGLGLAIVQAIVVAHGGEVLVDSAPGKGTCVTIRLPQEYTLAPVISSQ